MAEEQHVDGDWIAQPRSRRTFLRQLMTTAAVGAGAALFPAAAASASRTVTASDGKRVRPDFLTTCCRSTCKTCSSGVAYNCLDACQKIRCCICDINRGNCFSLPCPYC